MLQSKQSTLKLIQILFLTVAVVHCSTNELRCILRKLVCDRYNILHLCVLSCCKKNSIRSHMTRVQSCGPTSSSKVKDLHPNILGHSNISDDYNDHVQITERIQLTSDAIRHAFCKLFAHFSYCTTNIFTTTRKISFDLSDLIPACRL